MNKDKIEELIAASKLNELLHKKDAIYRYFTPDYLDDFDDDFDDDDFDEDFEEDDDEFEN